MVTHEVRRIKMRPGFQDDCNTVRGLNFSLCQEGQSISNKISHGTLLEVEIFLSAAKSLICELTFL